MQNVVRECRHEHGVGPTENSDHGKKQKNGQGARMIPHVTKSLQRLAEDPSRCFHWKMLRQPHHQETDDDCDEADSIDKKTERDSDLRHQNSGEHGAKPAA